MYLWHLKQMIIPVIFLFTKTNLYKILISAI